MVTVVGKDQIRLGQTDGAGDVRARSIDRGWHRRGHVQPPRLLRPETDLECMWAQGGELLRCGLVEGERPDLTVDGLPARGHSVDRSRLKPLIRPVGQADPARLLEAA